MDPYLGMIYLFTGNFAINGYATCEGQLLPISQNQALFSILGTNYGGNGTTNFGLPNLQGRMPMGWDQATGNFNLGQTGGAAAVTLTTTQLPSHTHTFNVSAGAANTNTPGSTTYLATGPANGSGPNAAIAKIYSTTAPVTALGAATIGPIGGGQPVQTLPPYLVLNYIIALQGIFPTRT